MQEPLNPPKIALKSKASAKIFEKTSGRSLILNATIPNATSIYAAPITGTITLVIFAIRFPPPSRQ